MHAFPHIGIRSISHVSSLDLARHDALRAAAIRRRQHSNLGNTVQKHRVLARPVLQFSSHQLLVLAFVFKWYLLVPVTSSASFVSCASSLKTSSAFSRPSFNFFLQSSFHHLKVPPRIVVVPVVLSWWHTSTWRTRFRQTKHFIGHVAENILTHSLHIPLRPRL